jgi:FHS family L-fucose permease-like MFS transporter
MIVGLTTEAAATSNYITTGMVVENWRLLSNDESHLTGAEYRMLKVARPDPGRKRCTGYICGVATRRKSGVNYFMAIAPVSNRAIVTARGTRPAMAMITALFFMWGFLTALNDILVPHLKSIFDLSYAEVMLIQFSFFSSYFVFAIPSGKVVEWIGYKRTIVLGLLVMGLGALLFIPAASVPSFPLFLTSLIVLAAGITALQVAANPYVAVLGPPDTASSRLNLTQAFNSLGTTIAPFVGSLLILSSVPLAMEAVRQMPPAQLQSYRLQQAASVKLPYLALAITLIVLAIIIAKFKLPAISTDSGGPRSTNLPSIWKQRHLVLGALGIFVYVGAEVSIGSFLVSYMSQPYIANIPVQIAARYVSFYWGGAMVGRFIGSGLLQKVRTGTLLGIVAIVAALLVSISMLTSGHVAMWSILAVGLFNSIMFPSIFTLGIDGLGPLTGEGSGILVCAIVGGALIPELQGVIADHIGIHHAFFLPVACYLYILYFALWGSRRMGPSLGDTAASQTSG